MYSNYVIFVGRIEKIKGVLTLLKAFKLINGVNLVIVGTGEDEQECKAYVKNNEITNVYFHGQAKKDELINLIRDSLFGICPSEWYENFPYAIVEGMLLSKPFIGSRIGGIPELVIDGYTGYTFRPGDVDDLRRRIVKFLREPDKIIEYGNNAFKHVNQLVNSENHYKAMECIFQKILRK